ncbi:MAG: hypothetical protein AB7F38_00135 [Piscinibacter sp.]
MDHFLGFVGSLLVDYLLIGTGRVVVYVLSFGRWRGEYSEEEEGRIFSSAGSLTFVRDGHRVITRTGLMLIGFAFFLVAIVAAVMVSVR